MAQVLRMSEPKATYMDNDRRTTEEWKTYYDYRRVLRKVLTPTEYLVFDILEDKAGETRAGWSCSYSEISELGGGLATHTISNAIARLEELFLVTVDRPGNFSQKIPNCYHPVKWPTPNLLNNLIAESEKILAAKNAAKDLRVKNCSDTTAKNAATSLQKMQTYVSHETHNESKTLDTDVSNGAADAGPAQLDIPPKKEIESEINQVIPASASSPPDTRSFNRRWRDRYEAVKDNSRDRSGVLGELWVEITGQKADYQLLNQLAKQQGSGFKVLVGLLKMAACDVVDDPKSYLRKVLSNEQQRGPYLAGNGVTPARTFQPTPKPIKPRGSRPDGGFTTAEYLEDY